MVKKSVIYPFILIFTALSWLDAKRIISQDYWYKDFTKSTGSGAILGDGTTSNQYWHIINEFMDPAPGVNRSEYTKVSKGTEFTSYIFMEVPVPTIITGQFLLSNDTERIYFSYGGVPIFNSYIYRPPVEVTIPPQPIPEQDIVNYPWAYANQEPLTHLKTVEQKNFNVDRYYLLEGKDSFDGVCNIVLKIRWNFGLNTLPLNTINQTQFCVFNASGIVTIHDSYIQNKPIEDGAYIHEFSHFNVDQGNIIYGNSEQIINGRFFYNYENDITVKAFYNTISVVSGASVTSIRNFELKVPVYENFTFK